jgi:chemotaxis protein MotA
MKKQDIMTSIGLILAAGLVIYGASLGAAGLGALWDLPSLFITICGSLAAVLITFTLDDIKELPKITVAAFRFSKISKIDLIVEFKALSRKARKEGLLSIEDEVSQIEDVFLKKGLEMAIDGVQVDILREILENDITEMEKRHEKGSKIYKMWGAYAPAFGMIGTLIGLVQMLADMQSAETIASGMAVALITTFYGSLLANIVCLPIANNLEIKSEQEATARELMVEGIISLQVGESTKIMQERLASYLNPKEREKYEGMP